MINKMVDEASALLLLICFAWDLGQSDLWLPGPLPCAYAYAYVDPVFTSQSYDISIITSTRTNLFVYTVLMLMSTQSSLAYTSAYAYACALVKNRLKQRRRRRQRERQKSNRFRISKTTTLHVHQAFLYISLPSLHDYDVEMPNFTFCGEREHKTTTLFFFCRTLIQSFRIQLQKKLPTFDKLDEMEYAR